MSEIQLNGKPHPLREGMTIGELVGQLGVEDQKIAVERNREIVPRALWESQQLAAGDIVEIINFVGGGR